MASSSFSLKSIIPSPSVHDSVCTLKNNYLSELCQYYKVNGCIFAPILPLPHQTANNPPTGYEAVYEKFFISGFNLPIPAPLLQILVCYKLRLPQITPNGIRVILSYLLYLRASEKRFSFAVFREIFVCGQEGSWYNFGRRSLSSGKSFVINLSPPSQDWKGSFFFVRNVGLLEGIPWNTGSIDNRRPSEQFHNESSQVFLSPRVVDWRKVDRQIVEVADLKHLGPEYNFRPLIPLALWMVRGI